MNLNSNRRNFTYQKLFLHPKEFSKQFSSTFQAFAFLLLYFFTYELKVKLYKISFVRFIGLNSYLHITGPIVCSYYECKTMLLNQKDLSIFLSFHSPHIKPMFNYAWFKLLTGSSLTTKHKSPSLVRVPNPFSEDPTKKSLLSVTEE